MLLPFRAAHEAHRIGALTLRGCGSDRVSARLRMEHALERADWSPPGLPSSAILAVRQIRLETEAPPGVEPAALARKVSGAVRAAAAAARRPWLHADAARADAVVFLDEAELAACLVRDWLNGAVADRWWWRAVLGGLDIPQWIQRQVLSRGAVSAPAIALLADHGLAIRWLARLDGHQADGACEAVAWAFAVSLEEPPPTARGRGREGPARATAQPKERLGSLEERRRAGRWAAFFPHVFHAVLPWPQKRLLAIAVAAARALSWARSAEFAAALKALERQDAAPRSSVPAETAAPRPRRPDPARQSEAPPATASSEVVAPAVVLPVSASVRAPSGRGGTRSGGAALPHRVEGSVRHSAHEPLHHAADSADARLVVEGSNARSEVQPVALPHAIAHPSAAGLDAPARLDAVPETSLQTGFGGLFFLLNAALALGLYADFTAPRGPSLDLSPWDWLAWTGREWFGDDFTSDAAWSGLAELAGRPSDSEPAATFTAPPEWSLPETWLAPWGSVDVLRVASTAWRLSVRHPAGFPIVDLPRDRARRPLQQAAAVCGPYAALAQAAFVRVARTGGNRRRSPRQRWLSALSDYLRARLAAALAADEGVDPGALVCRLPGRLVVTGTAVDVHFTLADLPLSIRVAGLDRDPGWIPAAGRSVVFHFS